MAKSLYDSDFAEWAATTANLIRAGRFTEIDRENAAEEIEDLSRSQQSLVRSHLRRLLMHKIKQLIQPDRNSRSWRLSIDSAREEIRQELEGSPSLRPYLQENLQAIYQGAVKMARIETGLDDAAVPEQCPWTIEVLLQE